MVFNTRFDAKARADAPKSRFPTLRQNCKSPLPLNFVRVSPDLLQLHSVPFACDAVGVHFFLRKGVDKLMGGCVMRGCVGCAALLIALTACLWLALHALRLV
jgi:hypothetical protein